ncbi:MAG TPA: protein-glutamate O-methyltransferase CheR [Clostridiales bacterium]|nr:protein-glutamate O-methyltransferase CheR [Clostridiales bacterium]
MNGYEKFKEQILKKTGIDLSAYKERQMKRRIDSLIQRNKFNSYEEFFQEINRNHKLFEEFINYLTINVSEFYRNPAQWQVLKDEIFPQLLTRNKRLKIWSAACSTGEEPYSLVLTLSELIPKKFIQILATDIDKDVLNKAKIGIYSSKSVANVPHHLLRQYFVKVGDSYQIHDEIKQCVQFRQHNLLSDPYPDNCDLIVCRNVLIYFTEESKDQIYKNFYNALADEGILFVGSTEQIILPARYRFKSIRTFFYQKE